MYLPDVMPAFVDIDKPNKLYVPARMESYAFNYIHSSQELNELVPVDRDEGMSYVDIIGTKGGDLFQVDNKYWVEVFDCVHTVPTVGYGFYEVRKKLKEVYIGLPGKEIGALRKQGVDIQEDVKIPTFVFLGDTTIEVFNTSPEILQYPVIVTECTFIDDEHIDRAASSGHTHYVQLEPYILGHPDITFILIHFSLRYKNADLVDFFKDKPSNVVPWITNVQ
eukprot:TRINITY_DN1778_c0_g1_i1.p1 TRINITY_DN1778_c0_g1~~TRINITY_DN1778_c0_g1_i1.p1  ORF type:complete len:222 (+),score=45.56 TRINITY_DN1778_c0_g1_i1:515-1180(+)